jgi:hypothetical protein
MTILHDVCADTIENVLAIPVLRGRKSENERSPSMPRAPENKVCFWGVVGRCPRRAAASATSRLRVYSGVSR